MSKYYWYLARTKPRLLGVEIVTLTAHEIAGFLVYCYKHISNVLYTVLLERFYSLAVCRYRLSCFLHSTILSLSTSLLGCPNCFSLALAFLSPHLVILLWISRSSLLIALIIANIESLHYLTNSSKYGQYIRIRYKIISLSYSVLISHKAIYNYRSN